MSKAIVTLNKDEVVQALERACREKVTGLEQAIAGSIVGLGHIQDVVVISMSEATGCLVQVGKPSLAPASIAFLEELRERARRYGWLGDYEEVSRFVKQLYCEAGLSLSQEDMTIIVER